MPAEHSRRLRSAAVSTPNDRDNVTRRGRSRALFGRSRSLFALLAADGISSLGNLVTLIAVPWFVLQTTGSAARTGIITFFAAVPVVLAGPLGGLVIDRLGTRLTSVFADILSGGCVATVAVLHHIGVLRFWHIAVLVFFAGLMNVPAETSRSAVVPEIAQACGTTLTRATSMRSTVSQTATLLGGPIAAGAIALFGPAQALYVDAGTFAISAVLICISVPPRQRVAVSGDSNLRAEFAAGINFIRQDRLLRAICGMVMFMNFLDQAFFVVLVPLLVRTLHYGAPGLGLIVGSFGLGALASTLAFTAYGDKTNRLRLLMLCLLVIGAPRYIVLAMSPPLIVTLAVMFVAGLSAGPINPILQTTMYRLIPTAMRGRVLGTFRAGAYGAIPLGGLVAGVTVTAIGLRSTLVIGAGLYVVATLSVTRPAWHGVNDAVSSAATAGPTGEHGESAATDTIPLGH